MFNEEESTNGSKSEAPKPKVSRFSKIKIVASRASAAAKRGGKKVYEAGEKRYSNKPEYETARRSKAYENLDLKEKQFALKEKQTNLKLREKKLSKKSPSTFTRISKGTKEEMPTGLRQTGIHVGSEQHYGFEPTHYGWQTQQTSSRVTMSPQYRELFVKILIDMQPDYYLSIAEKAKRLPVQHQNSYIVGYVKETNPDMYRKIYSYVQEESKWQ